METNTVYVVQFWVDGYEYWQDAAEPAETMFGLPTVAYATEGEGRARFDKLTAASPSTKYRLVRRTATEEVI